jgi:hypothetical protein
VLLPCSQALFSSSQLPASHVDHPEAVLSRVAHNNIASQRLVTACMHQWMAKEIAI